MSRLNDLSIILSKAKIEGFFKDITQEELAYLEAEAKKSLKNDTVFGAGNHTRRYRSLRYYGPDNGNITTNTVGTGVLYVVPFWVNDNLSVDRLASEVTTAGTAGAVLRMGIYNSTEDDLPNALQLETAAIDATTIGVKEANIDYSFNTGLYWLALVNQVAAITIRAAVGSLHLPPIATNSFLVDGGGAFGGSAYYRTGITGALPSSWGGTDTAGASAPKLMVRAK